MSGTPCVLRNGLRALVEGTCAPEPFRYLGRTFLANGQAPTDRSLHPDFHLWRGDGAWREDGTEHALDIVKFGKGAA